MSINEKIDIIDNSKIEEMYKTKEEVNSMLLTAIRKEKQQLINQGEAIGITKTALNMIKKNFDNETINEITGLSINKIIELRRNSNEEIEK